MAESSPSQIDKAVEKATGMARDAAGQAQEMVDNVSAQAGRATEGVQEVAGNLKGAVDRSLKDLPMATLATAAVVGFVLGALWKS
jgi:ElaB/YqjD/DUF883 family membrane-anchored ribosome-binding protein